MCEAAVMSGHTYTHTHTHTDTQTHRHTHIHTYTHTYTHDNYYNPRCAHAHRGLTSARLGSRACCCCGILFIFYFIHASTSVCNFVHSRDLRAQLWTILIRRRIVGVMFPPSIFEDRCVDFRSSMCRLSNVLTFEDR